MRLFPTGITFVDRKPWCYFPDSSPLGSILSWNMFRLWILQKSDSILSFLMLFFFLMTTTFCSKSGQKQVNNPLLSCHLSIQDQGIPMQTSTEIPEQALQCYRDNVGHTESLFYGAFTLRFSKNFSNKLSWALACPAMQQRRSPVLEISYLKHDIHQVCDCIKMAINLLLKDI